MAFRAKIVQLNEKCCKSKSTIRRLILVDRETNKIIDLPTVYIARQKSSAAFNTQCAILRDLSFYYEFCWSNKAKNKNWVPPHDRLRSSPVTEPFTAGEIDNLERWCMYKSNNLPRGKKQKKGSTISIGSSNARLSNIKNFFIWLIREFVFSNNACLEQVQQRESLKKEVERIFKDKIKTSRSAPVSKSLCRSEIIQIQKQLNMKTSSPCQTRDTLIKRLSFSTGLRPGELLKLKTTDLISDLSLNGSMMFIIKVSKINNDSSETRTVEPHVKTISGYVAIGKNLYYSILSYIENERRHSIENCSLPKETPYIFVNHKGDHVGKPISQRNLNRLFRSNNCISKVITPVVARHTHFTELAEKADAAGKTIENIQQILEQRGRWVTGSSMIAKYTYRKIMKDTFDLVQSRDTELDNHE
ncbi:site-specific integrase [Sansalvadorimonas sp. 2012CJ34-2]|uniref:Site-specific integrase n=1 Tax=Parendozoicomonas callyspongiae TaxID=2942213 RepID=A0ABT0PLV6_9GAMM|nr:site-specific integrase [Sansalvadorimonas sp. 2012CJ34-2]MCL6272241.1 site-specific integrase [Sansalvadorimonas sp. 2012CJ34-2]